MLRLVLALLLLGGVSAGQSPFDGSWVSKIGERLPRRADFLFTHWRDIPLFLRNRRY